jgi:hypothetical protein
VDRLFGEAGFEEIYWGGTRGWKVVVYERGEPAGE